MKPNIPPLACAACLLLGDPAFGAWTLVSDFQSTAPGSILRYFQVQDASAAVNTDAVDLLNSANKALYIDPGLRGVRCNAGFVAIPLPREVPSGATVTVKFDFFRAGPDLLLRAGLSPTAFVADANGTIVSPATPTFNDYEVELWMESPVSVRDAAVTRPTLSTIPIGEWMTFYIVANSAGKTAQGYLRTQTGGVSKLEIPVGISIEEDWSWRVGRAATLKAFYLVASNACDTAYNSADLFLVDNLSIDYAGVNLDGGEPPAQWAGYPLVNGYADTGGFLGWVYPSGDYVWVVALGRWAYLPESLVTAGGAWMYLFR